MRSHAPPHPLSPIERARGNLTFILLLALCTVASPSRADWSQVTIPDQVLEVNIIDVDGGWFTVAGANGAYEFRNGTLQRTATDAGQVVDVIVDSVGCFQVTTASPPTRFSPDCGGQTPLPSGDTLLRARRAANGGGYALGRDSTNISWGWFSPSVDQDLAKFGASGPDVPRVLSAMSVGPDTYGAFFRSFVNQFQFIRNGVVIRSVLAVVPPHEMNLYGSASALFALSASDGNAAFPDGGLFRVDMQDGGTALLSMPSNAGVVRAGFFEEGTGDPVLGDGFGMATAEGGISQPVPDPSAPAERWVAHQGSGAPNPQGSVVCREGKLCVATEGSGGTLHVYQNLHAPIFEGAPPGPVSAGALVSVDLSPRDPDGDPVFVRAVLGAPPSGVTFNEDGGVVSVSVETGLCGAPFDAGFSVTASDGVYSSQQEVPLLISPAPLLSPLIASDLQRVTCEGTTLRVKEAANSACSNAQFSWAPTGGLPLQEGAQQGRVVTYTSAANRIEDVVGQQVQLVVQVSAGSAAPLVAQGQVRVIPEPFVLQTLHTNTLTPEESELIDVAVELRNQVGCAVEGVEWVNLSTDLAMVSGTVRVNGVSAEVQGNRIVGLTLPASDSLQIRYTARPTLLGHPKLRGEARLNGVAISSSSDLVPQATSGCGCQSSPWTTPWAVLSLWWLTRRASRRPRSREARPWLCQGW